MAESRWYVPPTEEEQNAQAYENAVMAQVPIGYWKLNETQGNRAEDSSGNGHHGTYKDGVRLGVAGKVGKAANMNGTGYVDMPVGMNDLLTSNRSGTFTAIVRLPDNYTNWGTRRTSLEAHLVCICLLARHERRHG